MFSFTRIIGWYYGDMNARTAKAKSSSRSAVRCERLEDRQLLAATAVYEIWDRTDLNTHQSFGINASWLDGSGQPADSQSLTADNPQLTLELDNVPAHAMLDVWFLVDAGGAAAPGNDNIFTMTVGQQTTIAGQTEQYFHGGNNRISHAGDTLPIQFSLSNAESDEYAQVVELWVGVFMPSVSVTSATVTSGGDFEPVTATYADELGTAMAGEVIDVLGYDGDIVEFEETTATTGADGKAIFNVKGTDVGVTQFQAKARKGGQTQGQVQVKAPVITFDPGQLTLYAGQEVDLKVTVKDDLGFVMKDRQLQTKPSDINAIDAVSARTDNNGEAIIKVRGQKETQQPIKLGVSADGVNYTDINVTVQPILITVIPPIGNLEVGDLGKAFVRVTTMDGNTRLSGINVQMVVKTGGQLITVGSTETTDAQGDAVILFTCEAAGTVTWIIRGGTGASPSIYETSLQETVIVPAP